MLGPNVVTYRFIGEALLALLLLYGWNVAGRFIQNAKIKPEDETARSRWAYALGGIAQVFVLSAVLFVLAIFLISGVISNPTNFRYEGF